MSNHKRDEIPANFCPYPGERFLSGIFCRVCQSKKEFTISVSYFIFQIRTFFLRFISLYLLEEHFRIKRLNNKLFTTKQIKIKNLINSNKIE